MSRDQSNQKKSFSKYHWAILIGIVLTTCFLLLLLTEYIFRSTEKVMIQTGKGRYVVLNEPIINTVNSFQLKDCKKADSYSGIETIQFKADENGFLEPFNKNSDTSISIVFLGDATTAGLHLTPKQRFPHLTGKQLTSKTNYKVIGQNAGYPGNDLVHSTNRLIGTILPLKPDFIVLLHTINDLKILLKNDSYWGDEEEKKVKAFKFNDEKESYTDLFTLKHIRQIKSPYSKGSTIKLHSKISKYLTIDTTLLFQKYERVLTTFIKTSSSWGVEPILLTQFNHFQLMNFEGKLSNSKIWCAFSNIPITEQELITIHQRLNTIIKTTATENGITYIDADRYLSNNKDLFYDALHLNSKGADSLADILSDSLLLKIESIKKNYFNHNE